MASVYKRARDRDRKGSCWYINYTDGEGHRRSVKGSTDRAVTLAMARKLESDARLVATGVVDPATSRAMAQEKVPIREHLDAHHGFLASKGTAAHADLSRTRVARILKLAKIERPSEMTLARVQIALASIRDGGASLRTVVHYVRVIKGFSRWLLRDGRIREDRLAHLDTPAEPDQDRRHVRRAMTDAEALAIIQAAEQGPRVEGLSGPDRARLYLLAWGSGLRRSELASLTRADFDLNADPPAVVVQARNSKRRRAERQPIRRELAERLRPWLATKPTDALVFAGMSRRTGRMMQADCKAAGVPHETPEGVADFHSWRHTFITTLARSNAPVKVVQELARHSTPTLTLNAYTHLKIHDLATALSALPDPSDPGPAPSTEPLAATGTEGRTNQRMSRDRSSLPPLCHRAETGTGRIESPSVVSFTPDALSMGHAASPEPVGSCRSESHPGLLAGVHGNRTHLEPVSRPHTGFEDRGRHQPNTHSQKRTYLL